MRKNFEDIWKKYLYESCGKHGHIYIFEYLYILFKIFGKKIFD